MKKLMMAVAVVAAAVSANAATIQWGNTSTSKIVGLDGSTAMSTADTKSYLLTAQLWAVDGSGNETLVFEQASTASSSIFMNAGIMKTSSQAYTYGKESSQNDALYALFTITVGEQKYEMKVDQGWTNTQTSDGSATLELTWAEGTYGGLAGTQTAGSKGAWQAVPEPTSGLLMLLGFAGLALRRRRA